MRRRTWIGRGAGLALALAVTAAGCGQQSEPPSGGEPVPSEQQSPSARPADDAPELPAGWRWEAYGGVQVGVPDEFGWGNGDQRLGQWCVDEDRHPIVGRPGVTTAVGCGIGADTDPGTLLMNTGPVVAFGSGVRGTDDAGRDAVGRDGKVSRQEEGDRLTLTLNHVVVQIQAEPRLRERIAATVHPVEVDSHGCPTDHPLTRDASHRPADPVAVADLTGVTAVSACKYSLPQPDHAGQHRGIMVSSLRLGGPAAAAAMKRVVAAPVGGGPDDPSSCLPEYSYGDDVIVLGVTSDRGRSEVYLRYSGCDHNGFDDGTTVRTLTADAVAPFVADANEVTSFSGRGKTEILRRGSR